MQVAFHLGAHFTEPSALLRSLRHQEAELARDGVSIPGPDAYLPLLLQATRPGSLRSGEPEDLPRRLRQIIGRPDGAVRVILSGEDLLGPSEEAVAEDRLYPGAADRIRTLAALFPKDRLEFHLAIRSPATFLPSLVQRCPEGEAGRLLRRVDVAALRWSDLVARLRAAVPGAPVTVWCDEDMPLIWPEAVAAVAGGNGEPPHAALLDRLTPLLTEEGLRRLSQALTGDPPPDAEARRAIVTGILNRFGRSEAIEMDLDMPGWTHATIDRLSDAYEDDVERIGRMEGVHLIAP